MDNISNKSPLAVLSGSTGGLGKEIARELVLRGYDLILLDRSPERSGAHRDELLSLAPNRNIELLITDFSSIASVRETTARLSGREISLLIINAGAYSIPRCISDTGYDNVFSINFLTPYYMLRELMPELCASGARVIAVGSIAHNYSKIDENDIDFKGHRRASQVYGNAKRFLMFSLCDLFEKNNGATLAVTHPGITLTGITGHYPKLVFALIKHPMRIIFMKPKKAALSILQGIAEPTAKNEWIGPRIFGIWGKPKKRKLNTVSPSEAKRIAELANAAYENLKKQESFTDGRKEEKEEMDV